MRRLFRDEAGFTLIEALMAVVIIGLSFAAILGGFSTGILGSDLHRRNATGEADIRRLAEQIKAATYIDCAGPASYTAGLTFTSSNYSVRSTYWNGSSFVDTCPAPDQGLQKFTLSVTPKDASTGPQATAESLEIVKRR